MVFQSYALWPHMTVFANVAYPLRRRKVDRSTISQRVSEILALVGCENFAKRYPGQLSGGQQQRISLARALVAQPSIVLFDEPLSNLDAKLREQMRFDLLELHDRLKFTAVYVTHDRIEAMTVASRISVMRAGRVVQTGDARGVYAHPVDKEVADFMGAANFIPGRVLAVPGPGAAVVSTDLGELTVVTLESASLQTRQAVEICARPEQISLRPVRDASADRRTDQLWARCQVQSSTFQGGQWVHMVRIGKQVIRVDTQAGVKDSEFLMTGHDEVLLGLPQASLCAYGE
jgi:iron(III) transport system ATP-binding protein